MRRSKQRLEALAPIVITQGFIASDDDGNTVLLGRGGSDTSAAYLAAKLRAQRLEIWTDVPGMFSANPRSTPTARLLRALHYDEAQEIATSGAKVLHPRCILPARQYRIPLHVYATQAPELEGTVLSAEGGDGGAQVKAICIKKGITLISLESPGMWHQVGFLADAFQIFKEHGMSVDLVSTSETNVTVSLDPAANTLDGALLSALVAELSRLCRVQVIGPCASVSLVGRNIRAILHQLGRCLRVLRGAEDLSGEPGGQRSELHLRGRREPGRPAGRAAARAADPSGSGRPGAGTHLGAACSAAAGEVPQSRRRGGARSATQLLQALGDRDCGVCLRPRDDRAARRARCADCSPVARVHYAMKANPHPQILQARARRRRRLRVRVARRGRACPEAVSRTSSRARILFTPNFAPRDRVRLGVRAGRARHRRQPLRR